MTTLTTQLELDQLLDAGVSDKKVKYLLDRADMLTRRLAENQGYINVSIGVDSTPCSMGCAYCSLAAQWDIYSEAPELGFDEIADRAGLVADGGADAITLRTTQFYDIGQLAVLGSLVRERIGKDVELVANTGELTLEDALVLKRAGFNTAYHVVRLREGVDTGHTVEMRLTTIDAIRQSGLSLKYCIEPLGPEHAAEEILTEIWRARAFGVASLSVMARVPVMGTPLAHLGQIASAYHCRAVAAARLACPETVTRVGVHPFLPDSLNAGCNSITIELAANPRDNHSGNGAWRGLDLAAARTLLQKAGYTVRPAKMANS